MLHSAPPIIRLNGDAVRDTIPGLRTSAAFLSSLSTNLRLDQTSPIPSPAPSPSIPPNFQDVDLKLRPLSPLAFVDNISPSSVTEKSFDAPATFDDPSNTNDEELPSLYLSEDTTEREEAVRLVSESVSSQQYFAIRALVCHPLNICVFTILLLFTSRVTQCWLQKFPPTQDNVSNIGDKRISRPIFDFLLSLRPSGSILTVWLVLGSIALLTAFCFTYAYKRIASDYTSNGWLQNSDDVLVATSGADGRVLGTVVIGWTTCIREVGRNGGRKKRFSRAWIKAWAVHSAFQNQDIGISLLAEAVGLVTRRYGAEGYVSFAKDHAHSERVLPAFYNGPFDRRDHRAAWLLKSLVDEHRERKR